jgi:hypothetical protein
MVLAVVEFHRGFRDVWLQRVHRVREFGKLDSHDWTSSDDQGCRSFVQGLAPARIQVGCELAGGSSRKRVRAAFCGVNSSK